MRALHFSFAPIGIFSFGILLDKQTDLLYNKQ